VYNSPSRLACSSFHGYAISLQHCENFHEGLAAATPR
jgi:hypothetical protein